MDEVHIKNELVYDKHHGSLIGFVNLGDTNNRLLEFENALYNDDNDDELPLATSMLVLMVRGLFCKLNFPYAQFACNSMSGDLLFDPVWEAVSRLERLGFRVLGLTCDGASSNRRLWKLHSSTDEMIYRVPNIYQKFLQSQMKMSLQITFYWIHQCQGSSVTIQLHIHLPQKTLADSLHLL